MLSRLEFPVAYFLRLHLQGRDAPFQLRPLAPLMFHSKFLQVLQMREKLGPGVHKPTSRAVLPSLFSEER